MILFLAPFFVHAEVIFNEVNWAGTAESANAEWIEFYNNGSENVDLDGWKMYEEGGSTLIISLSKSIAPNSYFLVERTTPSVLDPVPGINDISGSFTGGGLNNSGENLVLKDSSGNEIQHLDFSEGWPAGDSPTKQTMQWNGVKWITAEPTPGAVNATENSEPVQDSEDNDQTSTTTDQITEEVPSSVSSHNSYVPISDFEPDKKFKISAGRQRLAVVGSPLEFQAEDNAEDRGASYLWSFGDGSTGDGERVEHSYDYAGEYVVILDGEVDNEESISRTLVQVVEPEIFVEEANGQFIRIQNNSNREINLYGFEIKDSSGYFEFPRDTIILPGASVSFSSQVTNLHPESTAETTVKSMSNTEMIIPNKSEFKEEEKDHPDEVAVLMTKALEIQKKIALLTNENQTEQTAVESLPVENVSAPNRVDPNNVAASVLSLPSPSSVSTSTSSTPKKTENSWIETIKHFFFGQ